MNLDDKSWTKIPVLHMAGRVLPEEGKAKKKIFNRLLLLSAIYISI
jgi:hypothetical protein